MSSDENGSEHRVTVGGAQSITIQTNRTTKVGKADALSVAGRRTSTIEGDDTVQVGGNQAATVEGNRTSSVGRDDLLKIARSHGTMVGKVYRLEAGDEVAIVVGQSSITMKKDGSIVIKGRDIAFDATGGVTVKASGDIRLRGSRILQN